MSIVLNEREYAKSVLSNMDLGQKPAYALTRVAKYYHAEGYKKKEITRLLEELIIRCDPSANIVRWTPLIDHSVKTCDKYPLFEIDGVHVTKKELEICKGIDSPPMQRLIFTLICLAKYEDIVRGSNTGWVNTADKEIFKMANVSATIQRQQLMYHELKGLGLITFSKAVDNLAICVQCLHSEDESAIFVTDFRNLGNQYLKFLGGPYIECQECGIVIRSTGNRQKYCKACSEVVNKKRALDRYHKLA